MPGKLKIDPEFAKLIPPLSKEELAQLETSLREEGCRDALVVWKQKNILLDGHNRLRICTKYRIKYRKDLRSFPDRVSAEIWVITNQLARRNLSAYQRSELALALEPLFAEKAKEKQRASGGAVPQKSAKPPIDTREELARAAGVSHDTIDKVKLLKERATPEAKTRLDKGETSINQEYQELRKADREAERARKEREVKAKAEANPITERPEKFSLVYADPPWKYDFSPTDSRKIENQYPTMEVDEIEALGVPAITEKDAVLALWATNPKLREALSVMAAWGFEYKTNLVWDKVNIGMGYYARGRHELLLIGTKGKPAAPKPGDRPDSIIAVKRGKHSAKPEKFYELLETMFPLLPNRVELFSRNPRKGWYSWGADAK